jgi:DNA-binding XRE family transcriptional regulator
MKRVRLNTSNVSVTAQTGRVSKYDPEQHPKFAKFMAERGATQDEIADCFGVSTRTLLRWLAEHPDTVMFGYPIPTNDRRIRQSDSLSNLFTHPIYRQRSG